MVKEKRIALVTGGVGGIGTAICSALARDGHYVVANFVVPGSDEKWAQEMHEAGWRDCRAAYGDVSDFEAVGRMVREIESEVGAVDVLVNCAGVTRDGLFRKMSKADWDAVINVNLNSAFNVTRHVVEAMVAANWGRIVNIASINAQKGQFGQTNYSAAKAGLLGFTKALAQELVKHGITVNSVSPGYVKTDLVMSIRSDVRDNIIAQIPAGRLAEAWEIAEMVAYLASDKAAFVTGANMAINGGQHMF
jgi:acetoacetyl-CoA reductase